jgi:hypothetical protein
MTVVYLILLAILSGFLGRMGGAGKHGSWYDKLLDTKWRDVGCSFLAVAGLCLFVPFEMKFWWVYLIIFGLHWGAFSTYWDKIFRNSKGEFDNFWFSGFMVGIAMMPACFIVPGAWWILLLRAVLLAVAWGLLHCAIQKMPKGVLCWKGDVAEEFIRYAISL